MGGAATHLTLPYTPEGGLLRHLVGLQQEGITSPAATLCLSKGQQEVSSRHMTDIPCVLTLGTLADAVLMCEVADYTTPSKNQHGSQHLGDISCSCILAEWLRLCCLTSLTYI